MTLQVYSDEKVNRLMQTFGTIVSISLLIGWLDIIIVRPAGDIADEMVNSVLLSLLDFT